jgi:hypothetical protein
VGSPDRGLTFSDGEVAKVKVLLVDNECSDVVVDLMTTNRPDKWAASAVDSDCAYTIALLEIAAVREVSPAD